MPSLPLFHVVAGRPVIVIGEGAAWEARCRLVERAGGRVAAEDCAAARLAFVALDDAAAAASIAERLRGRGLLVNVADRPELCDFTVPAVIERDPVVLAVGTGGASAGLAKWLRLRLEALLPGDLGSLAKALSEARGALRRRWPEATARRQALDAALGPGGPVDPFRPAAADRLADWLDRGDAPTVAECVAIQVRSDDPDDLTLREARLLGCADLVLYGEGVAPAILARSRADAVRRPVGSAQPGPGLTVVLSR